MNNRFELEKNFFDQGFEFVIGVDEVGRGPLAGPVVASAISYSSANKESWWNEVKDSKKISETKRDLLANYIISNSLSGIGVAEVDEIEQLNILQASLLAMQRAIQNLQIDLSKAVVLVDGKFLIPNLYAKHQESVIGGDGKVHTIASASIIAKVYRDKVMKQIAEHYPDYGFEKHKGYGTALHIEAIKKFGLLPVHRPSFCGNIV